MRQVARGIHSRTGTLQEASAWELKKLGVNTDSLKTSANTNNLISYVP